MIMIFRVIIWSCLILGSQFSFGLTKVSVGLKWVHQFQFAGIYAAKLKGFYKEAGLEVDVFEKQSNINLVKSLMDGKYDFIINDSAIVKSRLEGKKIIILSTLFQRSPLVFISLKEKNIYSPADWVGKRVMYSKDIHQPIIDLLLKESGTSASTIYHVNHSFKLDALMNGNIDVMSGYLGTQSYFYQNQGKLLNIIYPANYGIDFYGDLIVTTESYFNKNMNTALAFRQATLKGWDYALNHIDELVDHIYQSYSKHKSKEALKHEAFYIKKMFNSDIISLGHFSQKRMDHIIAFYESNYPNLNRRNADGIYYEAHLPNKQQQRLRIFIAIIVFVVLLLMAIMVLMRRQSNKQLIDWQVQNKTILDTLKDGVVVANMAGDIIYINPAIEKMFGFKSQELITKNVKKLMPAYISKEHDGYLKRYIDTGEARVIGKGRTTVAKKKDGMLFPIELSVSEYYSSRSRYFVGIIRDVSVRKYLQNKLVKINALQASYATAEKESVLFDEILNFIIHETSSQAGWISLVYYDDSQILTLKLLSAKNVSESDLDAQKACHHQNRELVFSSIDSSIKESINKKEIIIINQNINPLRLKKLHMGMINIDSLMCVPVINDDGVMAIFVVANKVGGYTDENREQSIDISNVISPILDSIKQKSIISNLAVRDKVTNLYNRVYFSRRLADSLKERNSKLKQEKFSVIVIDVRGFKEINEIYGNEAGDIVIKTIADKLTKFSGNHDLLARIGGDEFGLMIDDFKSEQQLSNYVDRLLRELEKPINIELIQLEVEYVVGICIYPDSGKSESQLINNAFSAIENAKKNLQRVEFFNQQYGDERKRRIIIKDKLKHALIAQEFYYVFQPQVDILQNKIVGIEALIRWRSEDKDISPIEFIPLLEEYYFSERLNIYTLKSVLNLMSSITDIKHNFKLSINISPQVKDLEKHIKKLISIANTFTISNKIQLEFEITETAFNEERLTLNKSSLILKELKNSHIGLALDDFGVKYSSLSRISELDFSTIKIDMSFIRKLHNANHPEAKIIIESIIKIASSINAKVIAEGVETQAQKTSLQELGCEVVQGYLYYKPMPWSEILPLINKC